MPECWFELLRLARSMTLRCTKSSREIGDINEWLEVVSRCERSTPNLLKRAEFHEAEAKRLRQAAANNPEGQA